MKKFLLLCLFLVFTGLSASVGASQAAPGHPGVLEPNSRVAASTPWGTIRIRAGENGIRQYAWMGQSGKVRLRQTSFGGRPSLTFRGRPGNWSDKAGVVRLRAREATKSFQDFIDARIWMQISPVHFTYNNNGLVVGWRIDDGTLRVEVWRFLINGRVPNRMPGAHARAIRYTTR